MIWDIAAADHAAQVATISRPTLVFLTCSYLRGKHPFSRQIAYSNPSILHVCYDSRCAALKVYKLAFGAELGNPIYFNIAKDSLYFLDLGLVRLFGRRAPAYSPRDSDKLLRIWFLADNMRLSHIEIICQALPRLQQLLFIERDPIFRKSASRELETITPTDLTVRFTSAMIWIRRNLRQDVSNHTPPEVIVGTLCQWRAKAETK